MNEQALQPKILLAIMHDQSSPPEITTSYADLHTAVTAAIQAIEERERNRGSLPHIAIHTAFSTRQTPVDVERDTCRRLCALAWEGQILVSGAAKATVQTAPAKEERFRSLGPHRLSNLSRAMEIYQVVHSALADDFPPLRSLNHFPHNLPLLETPFIGRVSEQARVKQLLSEASLVTLVGAGGSGKTRLALQVAANQIADYPDGVWVVDLALRTKAVDVPLAIAEALQIDGAPGRSLDDLLSTYLQGKRLLLVLDNCEHLRDGCADALDRLMTTCPSLTVLATSRERLELESERPLDLRPLAVPTAANAPLEQIVGYESVQLFLERAQRVRDFRVTADQADAIASICTRLDGIPLAIELAASQVRYQSLPELAGQLTRFLDMPSGNRSAPARQRTLRDTLDWSYNRLTMTAQTFWRYLSVAAGTFSLEMIEHIWSAAGTWGESAQELLKQMVDKSLVIVKEADGETRYQMLEPLRQYGREKLIAAGEEAQVNAHLLAWALQWTDIREAAPFGPHFVDAAKQVEQESENLKAALAWAERVGLVEDGLKLAVNLFWYWHQRQYFQSLRKEQNWLILFQSRYDGLDKRLQAKALYAEGMMAGRRSDLIRAIERFEASAALWEAQGDDGERGHALIMLGYCQTKAKSWAKAEQTFEQAGLVVQRSGNRLVRARYLWYAGELYYDQGQHDRADHLWTDGLALMREMGFVLGLAALECHMGLNAKALRRYETALQYLESSFRLERELRRGWRVGEVLIELVTLHLEMGRYDRAVECAAECLIFTERLGDPSQIAGAVIAIAKLLKSLRLVDEAVSLLLEIEGYMAEVPVMPPVRDEYKRLLTELRSQRDEQAMVGLYIPKRPPLHKLVLQAQDALRLVLEETQAKPQPQAENNWGLTGRECEVVQAVVDGLSREEIAEFLHISEKTVDNHLTNIVNKLGLEGRRMREIAHWGSQNGFKRTEPVAR